MAWPDKAGEMPVRSTFTSYSPLHAPGSEIIRPRPWTDRYRRLRRASRAENESGLSGDAVETAAASVIVVAWVKVLIGSKGDESLAVQSSTGRLEA